MCKQRQELEKICDRVGGCQVEKKKTGSGHYLIVSTNPDKPWSVAAPSTPSDWRGLKNMEADLRRRVYVEEGRIPDAASPLFVNLSLNQIIPDVNQPRKNAHQTDLEGLAVSILKHGVLEPILVMPIDEKSYRIIAGERRFLAAMQALDRRDEVSYSNRDMDFTKIPARIFAPMSDLDLLSLQMTENLSREDMSQVDTGRALMKFVEAGFSKEKIARHLGRSPTWVKSMLAQCSPEAPDIAARLRLSVDSITGSDMLRLVGWSKDAEKKIILDRMEKRREAGEHYSRTMIDEEYDRQSIATLFPSLQVEQWSIQDLRLLEEFYTHQDAEKNALAAQMVETGLPLSQVIALRAVTENPDKEPLIPVSARKSATKAKRTVVPAGFPVYFPESFMEELMGDDRSTWTQEGVLSILRKAADAMYAVNDMEANRLGHTRMDRHIWHPKESALNIGSIH